jgi:hypothetical protein
MQYEVLYSAQTLRELTQLKATSNTERTIIERTHTTKGQLQILSVQHEHLKELAQLKTTANT